MCKLFIGKNFLLTWSAFALLFLNLHVFSAPRGELSPTSTYVVDFVANAATGVDMNDAGDVIGTSRPDLGCGSGCLPPLETVVWKDGVRIVLPTVPGLTGITLTGINAQGWISGFAGVLYTTTHAVVWKPNGSTYEAIDLGNLPGKTISTAIGIDDLGRVVGWSTTQNFPPVGAPFMWTETGGMVNLTTLGFPNESPSGISPGGTVATYGLWYRLDDPGSVTALASPPSGFGVDNSSVAINDAGDQARFLVDSGPENLVYPFRYHHDGTWQQLSFTPTGHLSTYGVGGINDAKDVTVTVQGSGQIAFGPDGLAQPMASLVSPAYGGSVLTSIGAMNASGEVLAKMIIGQSGQRLVRLVPGVVCATSCMRVTSILMKGRGPAYCDQGNALAKAKVTVTDEVGNRLSGVTVTAHFFDDYYLDETVVAQTNSSGQASFSHTGPACVGAIALLVTDATSTPARALDRTTGLLTSYVIPLPGVESPDFGEMTSAEGTLQSIVLEENYPNPFNPSTTFEFRLAEQTFVELRIFDLLGREVVTLVNEVREPGTHHVNWNASGLSSGVYMYRLKAGDLMKTGRLTLTK